MLPHYGTLRFPSQLPAEKVASVAQQYSKPTLVMNIERRWFSAILAGEKPVEYRRLSDYWLRRLEKVGKAPFRLRLLNGMQPPVPEATVEVTKVVKNRRNGELEFHLGRVLEVKHWDRKKKKPTH
jgi:hypothetical protein